MQSAETDFTLFIDFLCSQGLIERDGIDNALSHLEGIDGIVAVGDYILGYEGLARTITEKSSFERLKRFLVKNQSMLSADPERRYYFVQSLLENPELKREEIADLVGCAPGSYQEFLKRRFLT